MLGAKPYAMNDLFPQKEKSIAFPTDYNSIIERIRQINPVQYGSSRNFVDGAVTYLSPYISRGVISTKQVHDSVLEKGHHPGTIDKFLQELAWREYFQRVWQMKGESLFEDMKQSQTDVRHPNMIKSVLDAKTGITAIDKKILEFYTTGYMHNHVRMYVASIACNIGKAHWSAPAQWMYYHLLDGDLASNTCSWQWVAGTFSSRKYYCNQENINRHTRSHQQNTFLDLANENLPDVPLPDVLKDTISLYLKTPLYSTTKPFIDTAKPTLIYNSYNLDPLWRKEEDVNRILLLEPSHFQKFPVSERVLEFIVSLSRNIPNCQIMMVSKEHPAFLYYPGIKDPRDWIYPEVVRILQFVFFVLEEV